MIEDQLLRHGQQDPKSIVNGRKLANRVGCSPAHARQVHTKMIEEHAPGMVPLKHPSHRPRTKQPDQSPPRPAHRPSGSVNQRNRKIQEHIRAKINNKKQTHAQITEEVANELGLSKNDQGRIRAMINREVRNDPNQRRNAASLTENQKQAALKQIVHLVKNGYTNRQIEEKLNLTTRQTNDLLKRGQEQKLIGRRKPGRKKKR